MLLEGDAALLERLVPCLRVGSCAGGDLVGQLTLPLVFLPAAGRVFICILTVI